MSIPDLTGITLQQSVPCRTTYMCNGEGSECKVKHLSKAQIAQLQQALLQEKRSLEQYIEQNDSFDLDQAARDSISELSLYDNHPGDIGTETFERGKDYALQERREY